MARNPLLHKALLVSVGVLGMAGCGAHTTITQEELTRRTQAMMDAVAPGDQKPWQEYVADDALFFDEKGRAMDKAALVKDIQPMPNGYSGAIKVVNPKSVLWPGTAILSYDLDETETVFGQNLKARYHGTDTWRYRDGKWQIVASQMLRYYEDPAVGIADVKRFPAYVGRYELAPGNLRTVFEENGKLFVRRGEQSPAELFVESGDVFFRKGVEGRILFRRDRTGKVDALIDRRNNEDIVWKRVPANTK